MPAGVALGDVGGGGSGLTTDASSARWRQTSKSVTPGRCSHDGHPVREVLRLRDPGLGPLGVVGQRTAGIRYPGSRLGERWDVCPLCAPRVS
jgi:hypothetical protein